MAESDIKETKSKEKRYISFGGELIEVDENTTFIGSYLAPSYISTRASESSLKWPLEEDQPIEDEAKSSVEINDSEIRKNVYLQVISNQIKELSRQHEKHDAKMTEEHQQMLQKLESENAYFRRQLTEINTPTKLQKSAFLFGTMSFISLGIGKLVGINLLHPIVAYFIFGISTVFYIMATMMRKQEKKQG